MGGLTALGGGIGKQMTSKQKANEKQTEREIEIE